MREINCEDISKTVAALCIKANTELPPDLEKAIYDAGEREESPLGRRIFTVMRENCDTAKKNCMAICQDTGITVVFCELGQDVHITGGEFENAINEGVRRGYTDGYMRMSIVDDPLKRKNTGDNTPAVIYTDIVPGDTLKITVAPKGAGSENMSALRMLPPSASPKKIVDFVVSAVEAAGGNPCPPVIVGVGIGGTAEKAMLLSKKALLRKTGEASPDEQYAKLEREILKRVNDLGIGPQGLGGTITALAVHAEHYPCHIASLPCAVCFGCNVTRHASAVL